MGRSYSASAGVFTMLFAIFFGMLRAHHMRAFTSALDDEDAASVYFGPQPQKVAARPTRRARSATPAEACHDRGVLHLERHEWDEAIQEFNELVKLQPKSAEAFYLRGGAWHGKEEWDKAIADYDVALRLQPRNADALCRRGSARMEQGFWKLALADLDAALGLSPDDAEAHVLRGKIREQAGEYDLALRDYQEAVRLESDNPLALNNLAWLLATAPEAKLRDGRRAVEAAARAVELEEATDWDSIDTLAAALAESGKFSEAVRCAKQALQTAPPNEHAELEARLKLYQAKRPFRLSANSPAP